jgi:hypothetical protein
MRNRILQSAELCACHGTAPEKQHERRIGIWRRAHCRPINSGGGNRIASARLRIQTIDSLNASLARRLPMLGHGSDDEIAQDQLPIYEAVCERLLEQLGDGSVESQQLETVLLHLANRVPNFMQMLCELLARRDHWLPLLIQHRNDLDLRDSIEHTLQAAIEHHLRGVCASLPADTHAELVELANFSASNRLREGEMAEGLELLSALQYCRSDGG